MLLKSILTLVLVFMSMSTTSALPLDHQDLAPRSECKTCFDIYEPVCGKSKSGRFKTFSNKCYLDQYNCQHPGYHFVKVSEGECPKESS
ncbi:MAG: hypothetical protein BYD32DRAFT_410867 [Podila humilis]|nr:MAG: hypothetical protein BYD32DRAFT_410867 [Podila humilis]